jgi:predicted CopG family antitoxin
MQYKTLNIKPETYDHLILYKHAGMSFDDVLNGMMKFISEKDFYSFVLDVHKARMKKIKAGDYAKSEDLDEALAEV